MKYKIPVEWTLIADIEVEASSLEEAIDKAQTDPEIGLPEDGEYLEGSWVVNTESVYALYPDEDPMNTLSEGDE